MVPVVLASTKTLLLYSAVPWLAGGMALGYMGKHFSSQNKLNLAEIKRQAAELNQLRDLHKDMESRISKLQTKLAESSVIDKAVKTTQAIQRKMSTSTASATGTSKGVFLKNLLDANVRLRKNVATENDSIESPEK